VKIQDTRTKIQDPRSKIQEPRNDKRQTINNKQQTTNEISESDFEPQMILMKTPGEVVPQLKNENDKKEIKVDEEKLSKAQAEEHAALLAGKLAEKMSRRKRREVIFLSY
jgi:hypothetical protein